MPQDLPRFRLSIRFQRFQESARVEDPFRLRCVSAIVPGSLGLVILCVLGAVLIGEPQQSPAADQDKPASPGEMIDQLLVDHWRQFPDASLQTIDDRTFLRRASLDLIGLLPTPSELHAFERDTKPDKRLRIVQSLLARQSDYADHWLTFWNDLLRNAYRGPGFIDDGRRQITGWLYQSLYENKPYDDFVRELINPSDETVGFTRGIVWRGVVNASQRREMQAAQSVSQVFLGTNLKCASCHDSFINDWTLNDAYGLASIFADRPLEIHQCDKPVGRFAAARFLFPEAGNIATDQPRKVRIQQLAALMTSRRNPRLSRTIVNRLWAELFGRGLIEPVDDMQQTAWHPELLDRLSQDFVDHHYDMKHLLERICLSQAYQRPALPAPAPSADQPMFRGPLVRRMKAEQFRDAIIRLLRIRSGITPQMRQKDGRGQGGQWAAVSSIRAGSLGQESQFAPAKWIWDRVEARSADRGGPIYLRRILELDSLPHKVLMTATCDNEFELWINGEKIVSSREWTEPVVVDISSRLKIGPNLFAVKAINWPWKDRPASGPNPAGFYLSALALDRTESDQPDRPSDTPLLVSDQTWQFSRNSSKGWNQPSFTADGWKHSAELTDQNGSPWSLGGRIPPASGSLDQQDVRSSLMMNDPLMQAMGRSSREQVVTRRDTQATTLQALELTNGETLNALLQAGSQNWLKNHDASQPGAVQDLIRQIFATALTRAPTADELEIANDLLGTNPGSDELSDLFWTIMMLDEFQLIY